MGHGKSMGSFDGPPIILYVYGWATKQKPISTFIQGRRKPGVASVQTMVAPGGSPPPYLLQASLLSSLIMINIIANKILKSNIIQI
jgi:hypothetical protein